MFEFLKRNPKRIVDHPSTSFYGYELPTTVDLNGGGCEPVFQPKFTLPAILVKGAGKIAGSLQSTAEPMVVIRPEQIIFGQQTITRSIVIQPAVVPKGN